MYYSLSDYFKETFGAKGYKVALSGGMTCPNRDGTCGDRGCIFCSGSGEFAQAGDSVTEQIDRAAEKIQHKNKGGLLIAYFQDYTNTYAPVETLRKQFTEAIMHPRVAVLSVATRPDCLSDDVVDLLAELNRIKPVWVELGLQTIHQSTARFIRRGYDLPVYDDAVIRLHSRGIKVITHLIIGLPGETPEMLFKSVDHVSAMGTDGIKLHLLHVLKGTDLGNLYLQGVISTLDFPTYLSLLAQCINRIPPNVVIHRLTGDGDKRKMIAPLWSGDKKHVLNRIKTYFSAENVQQGKNCLDFCGRTLYNDK